MFLVGGIYGESLKNIKYEKKRTFHELSNYNDISVNIMALFYIIIRVLYCDT